MISGSSASLRPIGIARYFGAVFLSVWLVGWLAGEVLAIGFLGGIVGAVSGILSDRLPANATSFATGGAAGFVILFLIVWLTLWTFGGIAALTHLLRSLAGEDSITLEGSGLEIVRRAGPFRRRARFDRSEIRRIRIRPHDQAVVMDTASGTHVLTQFGTAAEREQIGTWLRQQVGVAREDQSVAAVPPADWEVTTDGARTHVRKVRRRARAIRSSIAWLVAAAVSSGWFASLGQESVAASIPALVLTLVLVAAAALSTWGRCEWIVRAGELMYHRSFAWWQAEQRFRGARLEVAHHTDSDNDSHYKLLVITGDSRKVIHSQLHDSAEVVDLGRWLAAQTGFPLKS